MQDEAEARLALAAGADWIGLVSAMPSGPGPIPEDRIAAILDCLPDRSAGVLLTSLRSANAVAEQARRLDARTLQLCTRLNSVEMKRLRDLLPDTRLIPVVHVAGEASLDNAVELAEYADALLLDSGRPNADVPVLGGTGETHDWTISQRIVEAVSVPVLLAGGLHAGNVAGAIKKIDPWGIDVCSGVRTSGRLDPDRLHAFLTAVHGG